VTVEGWWGSQHDTESGKKRQRRMVSEPRPSGLFAGPEPRLLLLPDHVREYLRRLHDPPAPLDAFRGGRPRLRPRVGPL
jgi:hypothetical protein